MTWPKSAYLPDGVRYREEVWTGIEYQVAGHMLWEGLAEPALAMVRAVDERYDPLEHNPYNEVECGDHYARAMASWGVYAALCGFECHGPKAHIGFAPRLNAKDFRAAFTAAEGWGTFSQMRDGPQQRAEITLHWGKLRLRTLALAIPPGNRAPRCQVRLGKRELAVDAKTDDARLTIRLNEEVTLSPGSLLTVAIES